MPGRQGRPPPPASEVLPWLAGAADQRRRTSEHIGEYESKAVGRDALTPRTVPGAAAALGPRMPSYFGV
jgi:hypothetical protein